MCEYVRICANMRGTLAVRLSDAVGRCPVGQLSDPFGQLVGQLVGLPDCGRRTVRLLSDTVGHCRNTDNIGKIDIDKRANIN